MRKAIETMMQHTIKVVSLAVTAPVTFTVAGEVFSDMPPLLSFVMQVSAVALVELVLLINWCQLDWRKSDPPEVKLRYTATAVVLYVALLVLALRHGEGVAGIVFRLALGLAIAGSAWDTISYTARITRQALDKSAEYDWRVKQFHRKMARQEAIAARKSDNSLHMAALRYDETLALQRMECEHNASVTAIQEEFANHNGHKQRNANPTMAPQP